MIFLTCIKHLRTVQNVVRWDMRKTERHITEKKEQVLETNVGNFAFANWTALSGSRVVTFHISCGKWIVKISIFLVWSVISFWVTWTTVLMIFWLFLDGSQTLRVICGAMNCKLKNLRWHRWLPLSLGLRTNHCLSIERSSFVLGTKFDDKWKRCLQNLSLCTILCFLKRGASSCSLNDHVFTCRDEFLLLSSRTAFFLILENSTLRADWSLSLHVSRT